ncbi:50S ribosomal protein L23 [Pseudomonas aeruginosa]|uniref:50S ribosomal protein L23 n=1 Tax=Pseudomonas aeruginosa TaxID=287 RepID=UPI0010BE263F|nr:50S ribosomal protein L23 [Pseudomonas aeruginosa]QCJ34569.1 50S ribosomal protein L23 [Pseudomonas aeruginosa]
MNQERVFKVLLGPHISEKATGLATARPIRFQGCHRCNQAGNQKAVESLFSVKVQRVTTLNVKGKTKRTARGLGKRNDWKKAYIALQPGQDLDFATSAE